MTGIFIFQAFERLNECAVLVCSSRHKSATSFSQCTNNRMSKLEIYITGEYESVRWGGVSPPPALPIVHVNTKRKRHSPEISTDLSGAYRFLYVRKT